MLKSSALFRENNFLLYLFIQKYWHCENFPLLVIIVWYRRKFCGGHNIIVFQEMHYVFKKYTWRLYLVNSYEKFVNVIKRKIFKCFQVCLYVSGNGYDHKYICMIGINIVKYFNSNLNSIFYSLIYLFCNLIAKLTFTGMLLFQ